MNFNLWLNLDFYIKFVFYRQSNSYWIRNCWLKFLLKKESCMTTPFWAQNIVKPPRYLCIKNTLVGATLLQCSMRASLQQLNTKNEHCMRKLWPLVVRIDDQVLDVTDLTSKPWPNLLDAINLVHKESTDPLVSNIILKGNNYH